MAELTRKPPFEPSHEEDQRLEVAMGRLLQTGVTVAAVLVFLGGILALRHPGLPMPGYRHFQAPGAPASLHGAALDSISGVFHQLAGRSDTSIISLGLLVLIATPIARVIFAIIGFARERDMLYTVVSLIVLAILAFSLLHGR